MNAAAQMPPAQQAEFMRKVEEAQMMDSLRMYNRIVERCFCECVQGSMRTKKLDGKETECVEHCASKFIKNTQRVGRRFAEKQAEMAGGTGMPMGMGGQ